MNTLALVRHTFSDQHTGGTLYTPGGQRFAILERPWLDNQTNVSCIPTGTYECDYLPRSGSGKYRKVWWLRQVPGRTGILIHNGNLPRHTLGCLLIGRRHGALGGAPAVLASQAALRDLRREIGTTGFNLVIIGGPSL